MSGPAQLLKDCKSRGVWLLPAGDGGLTIDAPQTALSADLIDRLKAYKGELLALLPRPAATQSPAGTRDSRSTIKGPQAKADASPRTTTPAAKICRCGAAKWRDVPIHDGRSIRRDCARCGRFIDFTVWYGKDAFPYE